MIKNKEYLIGLHLSVAGGYHHAIEEGVEIGCTAIQIFTKSNRQWKAKPITESEAKLFIQTKNNSPIKTVIAHAGYLINLSSQSEETQIKSFNSLVEEINRCHILQIPYLVLHPGSGKNSQADLEHISKQIQQALALTAHTNVAILVETMAGQGNTAGSSFKEIATILHHITQKERIGVCFDTCHAFAAGYDFTTPEKYESVMQYFDATIGLAYLKAFHINDSKQSFNSHLDRHENIGEGKIPLQAFAFILNDPRFIYVPKILETPKLDGLKNDKKNMQALLNILD